MIKSKSDLRYYIREDAKNNSVQNKYGKITYRVLNHVIPWGGSNMEFYINHAAIRVLYKLPDFVESYFEIIPEV